MRFRSNWRRERDSNPRKCYLQRFSRPPQSTALPSLRRENRASPSHFHTFAQTFGLKHLKAVNKYFWKYRWRFLLGIIFIILSNYFRILAPQVTGYVVNTVESGIKSRITAVTPHAAAATNTHSPAAAPTPTKDTANYDILVRH